MKKTVLCAAAALLMAGPAMASDRLSYNFVDARYVDPDIRNLDGFSLRGSGLIRDDLYVHGGYQRLDGPVDVDQLQVGLGLRHGIAAATDLTGELSFLRSEVANDSSNGFVVGGGVRHRFTPVFEGRAAIDYARVHSEGNTSATIGGLVHLSPKFALGLDYTFDDTDVVAVGGRYHF